MTTIFIERVSCDFCGDDLAELRFYRSEYWGDDDLTCRACFSGRTMTEKPNFEDYPLAQEAAQ